MGQAIDDVLPTEVGVALSPMPVVAVILMLFSTRARLNGPTFVIGWVSGILLVLVMAIWLNASGLLGRSDDDAPSATASVVHLLLGVALLVLALRSWRKRQRSSDAVQPPGWMASLQDASPLTALGLGAVLGGVNPKNLALNIAAGLAISQAGLTLSDAIAPLVVYILIATVSVGVPVLWYLINQEAAARTLEGWRYWLIANNTTVMAVLLIILGAKQVGQGLGGLMS